MTTTWLEFYGLVSIYLDGEWNQGILVEVRENDVVYSLSGDPEKYIMSKGEAHSIIRDRKILPYTDTGTAYTGSDPFVFGPDGVSIYGKKITAHIDRANTSRVGIKYKALQYGKVTNHKINLVKHVSFSVVFVF